MSGLLAQSGRSKMPSIVRDWGKSGRERGHGATVLSVLLRWHVVIDTYPRPVSLAAAKDQCGAIACVRKRTDSLMDLASSRASSVGRAIAWAYSDQSIV